MGVRMAEHQLLRHHHNPSSRLRDLRPCAGSLKQTALNMRTDHASTTLLRPSRRGALRTGEGSGAAGTQWAGAWAFGSSPPHLGLGLPDTGAAHHEQSDWSSGAMCTRPGGAALPGVPRRLRGYGGVGQARSCRCALPAIALTALLANQAPPIALCDRSSPAHPGGH